MPESQNYNSGISIVELLVVVLIIGVAISALLGFGIFSLRTASLAKQTTQAAFLAQDSLEAVKNYRDNTEWLDDDPEDEYDGLGVVALESPYHPVPSGDTPPRLQMVAGQETIGIFTREIMFQAVERDTTDAIVESGGTVDPDTKKATVSISWQERGETRELTTALYLTNWR